MKTREYWIEKIEKGWKRRSIVWLSGVRRSGKTWLAQTIPNVEYFDCELPRVRRMINEPELFLENLGEKTIVLDEVHRLDNPSEILKIAADHYPKVRILATGSSMLGASRKFRDTLTGRKAEVWLTPMNVADLRDFGNANSKHRLLHGGLPPFFLAKAVPEKDFQDWMDAYWAKDIQELFRLEKRHPFQKFVELLMMRSGGLFEASKYAAPCEVSRPTISNYLTVLDSTYVAHIIRPFSSHRPTEITSAPKVFAFDTGFTAYYRGWGTLHTEELGQLWEHLVLNELFCQLETRSINYWRDKSGHELDFVYVPRGKQPVAIECKWRASEFDPKSLRSFRAVYPNGKNVVVAEDIDKPFSRSFDQLRVRFVGLQDLGKEVLAN